MYKVGVTQRKSLSSFYPPKIFLSQWQRLKRSLLINGEAVWFYSGRTFWKVKGLQGSQQPKVVVRGRSTGMLPRNIFTRGSFKRIFNILWVVLIKPQWTQSIWTMIHLQYHGMSRDFMRYCTADQFYSGNMFSSIT